MKLLIWSTVICVVSFTLAGIFYGYADFSGLEKKIEGKYNWQYSTDGSDGKEYGEKVETYAAEEVKKIEISSSISEVTVDSANIEKIEINIKFLNEDVEETYRSTLKDGVLLIEAGEDSENQGISSFFGNNKNGCKITVTVPKNLELAYDFKLALGALQMEGLNVGDFNAKLAAGNIKVEDVEFKSAVIKAAAGNINLKKINIKEKMEINAAAGNVKVEFAQADPNVEIKSAAGNTKLFFIEGVEPNLSFNSVSTVGELSVRKDFKSQNDSTYIFGEGKGKIEVKSTFGNVNFK